MWDAETGAALSALNGHSCDMYNVTFSIDGLKLASGSSDRTSRVWRTDMPNSFSKSLAKMVFEVFCGRLTASNFKSPHQIRQPGPILELIERIPVILTPSTRILLPLHQLTILHDCTTQSCTSRSQDSHSNL